MIVNKSKTGRHSLNVGGNPEALDHTYTLQALGNGILERREPLPAPSAEREPTDQELLDWYARYECSIPDNLTIKVY